MGRHVKKPQDLLDREELYSRAIKLWGREFELLMCIEECSELSHVLCKVIRNRDMTKSISLNQRFCEEIADVEIMLEQIVFMFDSFTKVRDIKKQKIARLKKLIVRDELINKKNVK